MTPFTSYRLLITPLSPIHIGTGESYEPTNYVIHDEALHEFDTGAVIDVLTQTDREELLKITERRPDAEMLKKVQSFFFERRERLMALAVKRIPVLQGVAWFYRDRVGQTANREEHGVQVVNRLEIERTGYNPISRQPVLFGSSMKGAMRTALLDQVNKGRPVPEAKGLHELQGRLLQYLNDRGRPILELDPLRLIQLSDAAWQLDPKLPASQVRLAVNRKKAAVMDKQGNIRKSLAEDLYQILECVPAWPYRGFSAQINVQTVAGIPDRDRKGQRRLPAEDLRFGIRRIAQACNEFYHAVLQAENQILRDRGYLDPTWEKSVQQLLGAARSRIESGQAFLLRVGRHSGAESVTLRGVRKIKIMEGKDPETGRNRTPSVSESAKTLWLAAQEKDQTADLIPFGWLFVEIQPFAAQVTEWDELRLLCERHLQPARAFAERMTEQDARLKRIRVEAEAKRRQEEETSRLRAEAEARRAQEKAEQEARLAAMSEEQRAIHALRQLFNRERAAGRKDPNGPLASERVNLLRKASAWESVELRAEAADLIEQTAKYLPWSKKSKEARQQELTKLRESKGDLT